MAPRDMVIQKDCKVKSKETRIFYAAFLVLLCKLLFIIQTRKSWFDLSKVGLCLCLLDLAVIIKQEFVHRKTKKNMKTRFGKFFSLLLTG